MYSFEFPLISGVKQPNLMVRVCHHKASGLVALKIIEIYSENHQNMFKNMQLIFYFVFEYT
jgi:hypothetical protein